MANVEFSASNKKITDRLEKFSIAKGVKGYEVGFFSNATYPDGTKVAQVAADNEFGVRSRNIPERPFFRQGNKKSEKKLIKILKDVLNEKNGYVITRQTANIMGVVHASVIQQSITDLKTPANSPLTIAIKKSSNPLIDTGFMRQSVTSKVI